MVINMCEYNNVPKIRFKGFTDVWEQRKLNEVTDVRDGTHDSPKYFEFGHPFITSKNVKNGYINYDEIQYISDEDFNEINKRSKVDMNDILFGMIGTIGNIALIRENPDFAIKNVALIKDIKKINYLYLYQYLQSNNIAKQFDENMDGGTQKFIALNKVRDLSIMYPTISEQIQIGGFLEKLDNLITLHQRKCDTLVNVKKSLLEKMFPKNSSNIPEIRFNEFTDVWEQRKLQDITQIVMGQSPDSINYTGNSDDTVLIQGNADLNNGIVVPRIWSSQITKKSYPNDIIFTVRAPVGEIARNPYFATIGRGVASFKGNDFLYQSLIQKKENNYWNNISAGSTFDSINSDQLKNVIIDLPKNNLEQGKIGELFTNLDNLITLHQRKLEKLKNIKKSMLEKMFV